MVLWPVMVATAFFIKLEDGWRAPVFYRQIRVGLSDRTFQMFKFRSMRDGAEQDGKAMWAQADDSHHARRQTHPPGKNRRTAAVVQRVARRDERRRSPT